MIQHAVRYGGRASPWLVELLKRKPPKLAAVALANESGPRCLEADGHRRQLRREIHGRRPGERGLEISQTRGTTQLQPC